MYAITANKARDRKTEKWVLCVRYVSMEGTIKECFTPFRDDRALIEMTDLDATSITAAIEKKMKGFFKRS